MQIKSVHFTAKELACGCGCGFLPTQDLIDRLDAIREAFGHSIEVNSGARCSTHNRAIGGARFSSHCEGKAADLARTPELLSFLESNMDKFNVWGERPEYTKSWIHIQIRPNVSGRWFIP